MQLNKLSLTLAASLLLTTPLHANDGAGANAATGSAIGGVSTSVVAAAVATVAVVAALMSSGTTGTTGTGS